jgi:quercetin dioxygenase-like cupin family protein
MSKLKEKIAEYTEDYFPTWEKPDDKSLMDWMETRIARYQTRRYDWNALKFQAELDPKYRRAQCRYMGTGATGVDSDSNTIPSEHFTFSTMILPAGCEGPLHVHYDAEEVFFVLRAQRLRLFFELDGESGETVLSTRDVISVPPGVYRGLRNESEEEALMCVMLGTPKPTAPDYPEGHPLMELRKRRREIAEAAEAEAKRAAG